MTSSHYIKTNFPVSSDGLGHTDLTVSIKRSLHVLVVGRTSADLWKRICYFIYFISGLICVFQTSFQKLI